MDKNKDFYENSQPGFIDMEEKGMLLQFSSNGHNVSDFFLEPSDVLFIYEELGKWLEKHLDAVQPDVPQNS